MLRLIATNKVMTRIKVLNKHNKLDAVLKAPLEYTVRDKFKAPLQWALEEAILKVLDSNATSKIEITFYLPKIHDQRRR